MSEYRVSFNDIEDGMAHLSLHEDDEIREFLHYPIDDLPMGLERDDLGNQFRPTFDDDGSIVELRYDEELTKRKRWEYKEAADSHRNRLNDTE